MAESALISLRTASHSSKSAKIHPEENEQKNKRTNRLTNGNESQFEYITNSNYDFQVQRTVPTDRRGPQETVRGDSAKRDGLNNIILAAGKDIQGPEPAKGGPGKKPPSIQIGISKKRIDNRRQTQGVG